jgi:Calcineurin-like phosphoesterase/Purple acid Phosphatase, N-terminal domain
MSMLLSALLANKPRQNGDHSYEPIPDCSPLDVTNLDESVSKHHKPNFNFRMMRWSVWAFVACSVGVSFWMRRRRQIPGSTTDAAPSEKVYHETFPTLLSLVTRDNVNNDSFSFVCATHNPHYDLFLDNPDLFVISSESHQRSHDPRTTIHWGIQETNGETLGVAITLMLSKFFDASKSETDRDDSKDFLVLTCDAEDSDADGILEVASLEQVRATHHRTMQRIDPAVRRRLPPLQSSVRRNDNGELVQTEYWHTGNVPSTLLRQSNCRWTYFRYDPPLNPGKVSTMQQEYVLSPNDYTALAQSNTLNWTKYNMQPTGIHIAYSSQADRLLIQFTTGSTGKGTPVVEYTERAAGTSSRWTSHSSPKQALGTTETYVASDMCQEPANVTGPGQFVSPGNLHTVALTDLKANTAYQYRVGVETGQGVVWNSGTYHVTTARNAGDHSSEFSFLVYGDQGCPPTGWEDGALWVKGMAARESGISMIHHVGDLSYADGTAHIWDSWLDMIQPISTSVPIMVAVGNHEYDHMSGGGSEKDPSHFVTTESGFMPVWGNFANDSGGECGVPTSKRFSMPAGDVNANPNNGVFWYWFDYGLLRTIVLSSEHDMSLGSVQHKWFETVLRTTNRTITPWVIVELHRPLYEGEEINSNYYMGVAMRYEIEDLLHDYQVDVVFAGHYHAYYRTYV